MEKNKIIRKNEKQISNSKITLKKINKLEELYSNLDKFQPDFYYFKIENTKIISYFKNEEKNIKEINKKLKKYIDLINNFRKYFEKTNDKIFNNLKSKSNMSINNMKFKEIFINFNKDFRDINFKFTDEFQSLIENFNRYSNKPILSICEKYFLQNQIILDLENESRNLNLNKNEEKDKLKSIKKNLIHEYIHFYEFQRQDLMICFINHVIGILLKKSLFLMQSNTHHFNILRKLQETKELNIKNEIRDYRRIFFK